VVVVAVLDILAYQSQKAGRASGRAEDVAFHIPNESARRPTRRRLRASHAAFYLNIPKEVHPMNISCVRCGGAMVLGQLRAAGVMLTVDEPLLSFVVPSGTATSLNPIEAVRQGVRGEPAYQERDWPVWGRACTKCGVVEFCLAPNDVKQLAGGEA
jgi:hypothetical protein